MERERCQRLVIALAAGVSLAVPAQAGVENRPDSVASAVHRAARQTDAASSGDSRPSVSELESAIERIGQPLDPQQLQALADGIGGLPVPQERERLRHLLIERLEEVTVRLRMPATMASGWADAADASADPSPDMTDAELLAYMHRLNLGPGASIEDLRRRDAIVAVIAAITDPIRREELLRALEERERWTSSQGAGSH